MHAMGRRPLPPPPGSTRASSSSPSVPAPRKNAALPPSPIYDDSNGPPPPPLAPRGGVSKPLPGPPQNQQNFEEYEAVDLSNPAPESSDEYYDDFTDNTPQSNQPEPELYDEWEAETNQVAEESDDGELYDEMIEGPPVGNSVKPPPLPPGRRQPTGASLPVPGNSENDGEIYDEMVEIVDDPRGASSSKPPPPPLPPGRRPPPREPSLVEESSEVYDEWQEETADVSRRYTKRSESPEEYIDPDELQDEQYGEEYEDPHEHDVERGRQRHLPIPIPIPPLPRKPGDGASLEHVQDTYELDSDLPPPVPTLPVPPSSSRPALPSRPAAPKKVLSPPKASGFDPAQILKVKLKKVDRDAPKSQGNASETADFRSVLRKTPGKEDIPVRAEFKPLQPPKVVLKPVAQLTETAKETEEAKQPKPSIQPRQEKNNNHDQFPKKVLVSPPPVNMKTHPPALKPLTPPPSAAAPSVQSTPDKPERPTPQPPNKALPTPPPEAGKNSTDKDPLESYPWYHGVLNRQETEERLRSVGGDGVFLVRKSKQGTAIQPYTMVILYKENIFNLKIRCRAEDQKIALGEEKTGEMLFSSVASLVAYHRDHNVILIGNPGGETKLLKQPKRL